MNNEVVEYKLNQHENEIEDMKSEIKKIADINTTLLLLQKTVLDLKDIVDGLRKDRENDKDKPRKLQDKIKDGVVYTIVIAGVAYMLKTVFGW